MTSLLTINTQNINPVKAKGADVPAKTQAPLTSPAASKSSLIEAYLKNQAAINSLIIKPVQQSKVENVVYKNELKSMFNNNQAKILAIVPRTFNAKDFNKNDMIEQGEEPGTFLNAIERLDEVKSQGFNTLHVLPVHPPGKKKAMGTAGSIYAPANLLEIDPVLGGKEGFKKFIDEAHKRGIKVMLDLPSCVSFDMFEREPELMAIERDGLAKTPQGWDDIRMFQPWQDAGKRILNPKLLDLHKQYVDMCVELGVDGIRADVARAKPVEFWNELIPYSHAKDPQFAWLAEAYTYEDASPQANMPYDRPLDSLKSGFDAYYGQFHIFHEWNSAKDLNEFVKENIKATQSLDKGKSMIGSFATHDDISPMFHGGVEYCNLTTGLQATLPMVNPYIVDGFQTGDKYVYQYEGKHSPTTMTENHEMTVHRGKLDIFNFSRKPGGEHQEISKFMTKSFQMRDKFADIIEKGSFIELEKADDKNDEIIAYARHFNGKTLLVVANKNVDRSVAGIIKVPTMKANQQLKNLLPSYGQESIIQGNKNELKVDLGPARIHVFEIDTPEIEKNTDKVFKQNI